MAKPRSARLVKLMATARSNPEFATQLMLDLPSEMREEMVQELATPEPALRPMAAKAAGGPGLRKCRPAANNGMSAQLNVFARSVSRVS